MLRTITWILILLATLFFFFSLRSTDDQLLYGIIALGLWGAAFRTNKYAKREEEKKTP